MKWRNSRHDSNDMVFAQQFLLPPFRRAAEAGGTAEANLGL